MIRFLLSFSSAGAALVVWNWVSLSRRESLELTGAVAILATLWLIPTTCVWLVARRMHHRRNLRLFVPARGARTAQVALGLTVGMMAQLATAAFIVFFDRSVPDVALTAAAAIVSSAIVLWRAQPVREGFCIACDYDLRSSHDSGRCPECGLAFAFRNRPEFTIQIAGEPAS
jgi:hypothetical protein